MKTKFAVTVLLLALAGFLPALAKIGPTPEPWGTLPAIKRVYLYYFPWVPNQGAPTSVCGLSPDALALEAMFLHDPNQQRQHPTCDAHLVAAATHRAQDMASNNYFAHIDLDGRTPNQWARISGCQLPDYYRDNENNIESIALNQPTAQAAWQAWLGSPGHRVHVLGLDFWQSQNLYGMASARAGDRVVWVLMSAPSC